VREGALAALERASSTLCVAVARQLSCEVLTHYQRVVVALKETIRLMAEIDSAIDSRGGWPIEWVNALNGNGTMAAHGNAKKKDVCRDGSKDEDVFYIQQGVAICLMLKLPQRGDKVP